MSKELTTPLEALEEIKKYSKVVANSEELNIIETALKALEIIKTIPLEIEYNEENDDGLIYIVLTNQDCEYKEPIGWFEGKENFDLLKEVLK